MIPKPLPQEERGDFVSRCVIAIRDEYGRRAQMICAAEWDSERGKTMLWKTIDQQRNTFNRKEEDRMYNALQDAITPILKDFKYVDRVNPGMADHIDRKPMTKAYEELYMRVVPFFGDKTYRTLKSIHLDLIQKLGPEELRYLLTEYARSYVSTYLFDLIQNVNNETIAIIRRIIDRGINEGLGPDEMARQLKTEYGAFSTNRATRIARTEVIRASNVGADAGAKQTGLALDKVWVATRDSRTRSAHENADNQRKGMEEDFMVAGIACSYPCDPRLPASQSVNCRCTVAHVRTTTDTTFLEN